MAKKRCVNMFCGNLKYRRHVWRGQPLDEFLGIENLEFKVSRMMTLEIAYWSQNQHSYTGAVFIIEKLYRIKLSASLVERVTDYAGKSVFEKDKKQAEETENNMTKIPCKQGKKGSIYIEIDGCTLNTRKRDKNGSSYREIKSACVFTSEDIKIRTRTDGKETRKIKNRRYISIAGSVEEFKKYLFDTAVRAGCFEYEKIVILSDGAEWIRAMCEELFPGAVMILDFYHAAEHIYDYAKFKFNNNEDEYIPYAQKLTDMLMESMSARVFAELSECEGKKYDCISNPLNYLRNNRDRIDYAKYKSEGLFIGSGIIESAQKVLVQRRLKQPGMRWNLVTAQYMLTLRAKQESGLWNSHVRDRFLKAA